MQVRSLLLIYCVWHPYIRGSLIWHILNLMQIVYYEFVLFLVVLICNMSYFVLFDGVFFFRLENHQAQSVWRITCSVVTLLRITFISCHVLVQQKSPPRRQTPDLSLSKHCIIKTSVNLHDQNSLNQVENLVMCNFWTLMEQCFTFPKMLRPGILPEKK